MFKKIFKSKKSEDKSRKRSNDSTKSDASNRLVKTTKLKRKKFKKKLSTKRGSRPSSRSSGSRSLDLGRPGSKVIKSSQNQLKPRKISLELKKDINQPKKIDNQPKKVDDQPKKIDSPIRIKPVDKDTSIDIQIQIKQSPTKAKDNILLNKSLNERSSKELVKELVKESVKDSIKLDHFKKIQKETNESIEDDQLPAVPFNTLNQNLTKTNFANQLNAYKLDKYESSELFLRLYKLKNNKSVTPTSGFSLGKEKSKSGRECRICLQLIEDESNLIQPCACTGSQAFVHKQCLHEWIRIRASNKCDVCNKEYTGLDLIKRHRGLLNWISSNPVIFFYLISGLFLGIFFFYILFIGYLEYKTSDGLIVNSLRIVLLVISIFYTILFAIIFISLIVKAILIYLSWRQENYTVTLGPLSSTLMTINESVNASSLQPVIDQMSKNQSNELRNKSSSIYPTTKSMPINSSQTFIA